MSQKPGERGGQGFKRMTLGSQRPLSCTLCLTVRAFLPICQNVAELDKSDTFLPFAVRHDSLWAAWSFQSSLSPSIGCLVGLFSFFLLVLPRCSSAACPNVTSFPTLSDVIALLLLDILLHSLTCATLSRLTAGGYSGRFC